MAGSASTLTARSGHDAPIAATALQHALTLVTRNPRDFAAMRVSLRNPREGVASG